VAALISTQKTPLPYLTLLKRRSSRGSTSDTRRRLSFSIVDTADHYAHAENHAFPEELDTHYVRLVLGILVRQLYVSTKFKYLYCTCDLVLVAKSIFL